MAQLLEIRRRVASEPDSRGRIHYDWQSLPDPLKAVGVAPGDVEEIETQTTSSYSESWTVYLRGRHASRDLTTADRLLWRGTEYDISAVRVFDYGPTRVKGTVVLMGRAGEANG